MLQVVQMHARTGAILTYLEELRNEKEQKARVEYVRAASNKPKERVKTEEVPRLNLQGGDVRWSYAEPLSHSKHPEKWTSVGPRTEPTNFP